MTGYLKKVSNGRWAAPDASMSGPKVKILVWDSADGGLLVEDDSSLSAADAKRLELDQNGSPYGVLVWDSQHVER